MPQINRIRIINFSYNNHHRNIVDETFDFFQGENALLSLKNGGGKSVLVQLLLQPILPKTRLMSRRMEDFFKGKKAPSYILLEWKLEDQGGYLLTGIGLANRESQVRDHDEANNALKYFTFTSHYREENGFDLEHIPLVKQSDSKIFIEDIKEVRRLLTGKGKENVTFFSEEEGADYRKHLESFNIFQDEWKSIVLKINESEGGVIEIFEKCKTSQQLMNDWILKSIEKVVHKDETDQKKLEQMLENLVEEMIRNEQFIYEKDLYQEFLGKSDEFIGKLNDLLGSLDREREAERTLAGMYYFLIAQVEEMKKEIHRFNEAVLNSEQELKRIDLEERSKDYHDAVVRVDELTESVLVEERKLKAAKSNLDETKLAVLVQQAAREYGNIKIIGRRIAGLETEIEKIRSNDDHNQEIQNLEYSLKIGYQQLVVDLQQKEAEVGSEISKLTITSSELEEKIKKVDEENKKLAGAQGELKSKIKQFEKVEPRIRSELGLEYERNLLGEIEQTYQDEFLQALEMKIANLKTEVSQLHELIETDNQKLQEAKEKERDLRKSESMHTVNLAKLDERIVAYNDLETALKPVFARYHFDYNKRFQQQETQSLLIVKIRELEKIERELQFEYHSLNETITALQNGTLHVSNEFRQWLINEDIDFETGENYLRKQSAAIRKELVKQNPILPYAFLIYDEDLEKVKFGTGFPVHQMVPVLSYKTVNQSFAVNGRLVSLEEKLNILCLYDERMIDADNLESYLAELLRELVQVEEQQSHYREQLETVREDQQLLKQFVFDENYLYSLENSRKKLRFEIKELQDELEGLEGYQRSLLEEINQSSHRIEEIKHQLETEGKRKELAIEFFQDNELYVLDQQKYKDYEVALSRLEIEKKRLLDERTNLTSRKEKLLIEQERCNRQKKEKEIKYAKYQSAVDSTLLKEDVDVLEERLQVLKSQITSDLSRLENDLEDKKKELRGKKADLSVLPLEESQYIQVEFNEDRYFALNSQVRELETEVKGKEQHYWKADGDLREAKGTLFAAEQEVKKLAEAPLEPGRIKLNFSTRRIAENAQISFSKGKIKEIGNVSKGYEHVATRIEGKIQVELFEVNTRYEVQIDVEQDYQNHLGTFTNLQKENTKYENNIKLIYSKLNAQYRSKNNHLENILAGWEPLMQGAQSDRDKYYYLGERMLLNKEALVKLIRVFEERLSNIEKNKQDLVHHSYLQGKQVFDEIQKITENSSIRLEDRNRPIPMLKINMEPLSETETENRSKMQAYVESCISIIKQDMKEDKKIEEIRKKISRYMSTKELLNILSDLGKMKIYAYKIDINAHNSTYKSWEQVMKENSGGERFVSFFAVIVALMSYTRTSMKVTDDYQRNRDTKVLIMDNPFGPISSEHLLKPLFQIAKKYNTQLICLTDLKQNSILNCFNLIYMLKIRQNVFGTSEYLQLKQQVKQNAAIEKDERLEKAVFKVEEGEQMSLL
jgi:hypothetical protein